jgi:hypothetical protein
MHGTERVVALPQGTLEQYDLSRDGLNNGAFSQPARVKTVTLDVMAIQPLCAGPLVGADEPDTDTIDMPARAHGVSHASETQTDFRTSQKLANDLAQHRQIVHQ